MNINCRIKYVQVQRKIIQFKANTETLKKVNFFKYKKPDIHQFAHYVHIIM